MISDFDTIAGLLLAAVLGSLIGFERERLLWAAGIRTHMLVCVSACLLMILSAYGFQHALRIDHVILEVAPGIIRSRSSRSRDIQISRIERKSAPELQPMQRLDRADDE